MEFKDGDFVQLNSRGRALFIGSSDQERRWGGIFEIKGGMICSKDIYGNDDGRRIIINCNSEYIIHAIQFEYEDIEEGLCTLKRPVNG